MIGWISCRLKRLQEFEFSRYWFEQNRTLFVRLFAIVLLIFYTIYIVPRAVVLRDLVFLAAIFGVIALFGMAFLLSNPSLPFLAFIPTAFLISFGINTGTGTSFNAAVLLAMMTIGLWLIDSIIRQKRIHLVNSLPVKPALALMAAAILAFIFGQLPWFLTSRASIGAQLGELLIFLLAGGMLLVTGHLITFKYLEWSVWLFLAISAVYILARFREDSLQRIVELFTKGSSGSVFWVWLIALLTGQILCNKKLNHFVRAGLGIVLLFTLWVSLVIGQDWTSGWLPPLVGVVVIIWFAFPKLRPYFFLVAGVVLALKWNSAVNYLMGGDNEYSLSTRLAAWDILFKIIQVNPVTGVGPANYYFYTPQFSILGYSVQFNSHNNYIDLLAQTGVIGTSCFLWLMASLVTLGIRLRKRVEDGFIKAFVYSAIGGVAGMTLAGMFGDWVIPFVYNIGMEGFRSSLMGWMFAGGLIAIDRLTLPSKIMEK
jgi:O-antigen ligase